MAYKKVIIIKTGGKNFKKKGYSKYNKYKKRY